MKNITFAFIVFVLVSSIFIPSINFAYATHVPDPIMSGQIIHANHDEVVNGGLVVDAGGELIVDSGITLTINGSLQNNGKITVDGDLIINGGLLNNGKITVDGFLNVAGTGAIINNLGAEILIRCGEFVTNGAHTINSGIIDDTVPCEDGSNIIEIVDDIGITETLTIPNGDIGIITDTVIISGTLENKGNIENRGHIILDGGIIKNFGTITNFCTNFGDKGISGTSNGARILPPGTIVNENECAAPEADDDSYVTDEDEPLSVPAPGVLDNDTNAGSSLTASFLSFTDGGGDVEMNDDGSFTFTPDDDFFGTFKFEYQVEDEDGGKDAAIVTIEVAQINDAPVADDDDITVNEDDGSIDITDIVLDGDTDIDPTFDILSIDNAKITTVTTGQVELVAGSLFYNPNGQFEILGIGETGTDTFDYTISDGNGGISLPALVTVTINGQNDAPVADDDGYSVNEDESLSVPESGGVLIGDTDIEDDDLTSILDDDVDNGVLALNSDGSFTYTPEPDFFGTDSFTYHANDGLLDSNIVTVTITVIDQVEPDLEPPIITVPAAITAEATSPSPPGSNVDIGTATATDIVDPAPLITNDAPALFPLGETTVTWTATDDSGNSVSDTQLVTLVDTTSPSITAPSDVFKAIEGTETTLSNKELGTATATDIVDLDLEITNDAPDSFLLGDTTVTWTATDDSGNSVSDTQLVTIEQAPDSLREEKTQIVEEIESLLGEAEDKKTIKELEKSIKEVQKSLDDKLWKDDVTLESKQGQKVFDHEKHAVKKLMKIENNDDSTDVSGVIDSLVEIDRKLASDAFDKANTPENQGDEKSKKELEKFESELEKGDQERDNGKFDKAIDHYKKAWKHAQKAMKHDVKELEEEYLEELEES